MAGTHPDHLPGGAGCRVIGVSREPAWLVIALDTQPDHYEDPNGHAGEQQRECDEKVGFGHFGLSSPYELGLGVIDLFPGPPCTRAVALLGSSSQSQPSRSSFQAYLSHFPVQID
jgi:hypothetical protein